MGDTCRVAREIRAGEATSPTMRTVRYQSTFATVASLPLLVSACETVRWEFERSGLDGLSNVDGVSDGVEAGALPGELVDAGALAFAPGPPCPELPLYCEGDARKCTLVDDELGEGLRTGCVTERAQLAIGVGCSRDQRGDDNCAAGGFCTPLGIGSIETGPMVCRELCLDSEQCDERCLALERGEFGLCVGECSIFSDDCAGEQIRCAAGADVSGSYFGYCARYGDGPDGDPCESDADCNQGAICQQSDGICRAMCDAEHPCDADLRCVPLGLGDPQSPRLCIP